MLVGFYLVIFPKNLQLIDFIGNLTATYQTE